MTFLTLKLKEMQEMLTDDQLHAIGLRKRDAAAPLTGNPHGPRKAPFACGDGNIWRQDATD